MSTRIASLFAAALALPLVACVGDDLAPIPADEPTAAPAAESAPELPATPPAAPSARVHDVNVRCLEGRYATVSFTSATQPSLAELDFVPVLNPPPGGSGPWYTSREVAVYGPCFRDLGHPTPLMCWLNIPVTSTCDDLRAQLDQLDVHFGDARETYDLRPAE